MIETIGEINKRYDGEWIFMINKINFGFTSNLIMVNIYLWNKRLKNN